MKVEQVELDDERRPAGGGDMPRLHHNTEFQLAIPNQICPQAGQAGFLKKLSWVFQGLWHTFRPSQFRRHFTLENGKYLLRRYTVPILAVGGLLYWLQTTAPFERRNNAEEAPKAVDMVAGLVYLPTPEADGLAGISERRVEEPPLAKIPNTTTTNTNQVSKSSPLLRQLEQVPEAQREAFLRRFGKVAQDEMQKFGVPASVTLAFAVAYSEFGTNALALEHHNFFAIQCNENQVAIGISGKTTPEFNPKFCFMHFDNAWSSFRSHSQMLAGEAYEELAQVAAGDYKVWAAGLERIGYRQHDASFSAESLREIIEAFDLQRFDTKINP